jgi:hypothetical protein
MLNRVIKLGNTFEGTSDIGRLYDMSRPGKYHVQVSRRASENEKDGVVESNKIRVTVTPWRRERTIYYGDENEEHTMKIAARVSNAI